MSSPQHSPSTISNQSSTRKTYHIRSESSVLRSNKKSLARNRSHTADSTQYKHQYKHHHKHHHKHQQSKNSKKRVNRRFDHESIPEINKTQEIKYNLNGQNEIFYHHGQIKKNKKKKKKKVSTDNNNSNYYHHQHQHDNYHQHELQTLVQQFRNMILPLQTEISSLRQITQELRHQIGILQYENRIYRQNKYHYTNQSSPNQSSLYVDHFNEMNIPNIPNIPNNHISNVANPVYLFNSTSKRREVSMGTMGTQDTVSISNIIDINYEDENTKNIDKVDRMISQSLYKHGMDEEDDLEIDTKHGSKIHFIDNDISQIYLDTNMDISDDNDIPITPQRTLSGKSIDKTYHERENSINSISTMSDNHSTPSSPTNTPNYKLIESTSNQQHKRSHINNMNKSICLRDSISLPTKKNKNKNKHKKERKYRSNNNNNDNLNNFHFV